MTENYYSQDNFGGIAEPEWMYGEEVKMVNSATPVAWSLIPGGGGFFLWLVVMINVFWVSFIPTTIAVEIGIPAWFVAVPFAGSILLLIIPAMMGGRLRLGFSVNRLMLLWFILGLMLSLYNHPLRTNGMQRLAGLFMLGFISYILLPAAYRWDRVLAGLRVSLIVITFIMLLVSVLFFPVVTVSLGSKVGGVFRNRNTLGFMAFIGLVALGGRLPKHKWLLIGHLGMIFFYGAILMVSRSRTSMACALVAGIMTFWRYRGKFSMWLIAIVTILSLALFVIFFTVGEQSIFSQIIEKFEYGGGGEGGDVTSGRFYIWHVIQQLSEGYEITGLGIGSLVSYYDLSPHNAYVALFYELGYLGFPGFILWVLSSLWQGRSIQKYCDDETRALVQNMFVLLVGLVFYNLFENAFGGVLGLGLFIFWVVTGAVSNGLTSFKKEMSVY